MLSGKMGHPEGNWDLGHPGDTGTHRGAAGHTGGYWDIQKEARIHRGYWETQGDSGTHRRYWDNLGDTGIYWDKLGCIGENRYTL